jgi:hypothetical protein
MHGEQDLTRKAGDPRDRPSPLKLVNNYERGVNSILSLRAHRDHSQPASRKQASAKKWEAKGQEQHDGSV